MLTHSLNRPYSYRFPFRASYGYLIVALAILLMSWEGLRVDGAIAGDSAAIPQQAIRLRILANSDSAVDQAMKRRIRDAIVSAMNGWAEGPQTIEQARSTLNDNMGEIERIVGEQLQSRGFQYGFKAELGEVAFPTKLYGDRVYPAGNYEALLITLGQGEGQNWWCVLFPPLCFIDSASGEATQAEPAAAANVADGAGPDKQPAGQVKTAAADAGADAAPEAKFFILELIESIVVFFKHLFS